MSIKNKRIILAMVLLCIIIALIFVGRMVVANNRCIRLPGDPTEEFSDYIIESLVNSAPNLGKKTLLGSEDAAKEYAQVLYKENYEDFEEWLNNGFEIWVKHYKEYGVWLARMVASKPHLDGPPWIIFQDSDGRVIYYSGM